MNRTRFLIFESVCTGLSWGLHVGTPEPVEEEKTSRVLRRFVFPFGAPTSTNPGSSMMIGNFSPQLGP